MGKAKRSRPAGYGRFTCVVCKKEFPKPPYCWEPWVGDFCSQKCQDVLDDLRDQAWKAKKGDE